MTNDGTSALAIVPTPQQRMSTLLIANNDLMTVNALAKIATASGLAKVSNETQAAFIILKGLELGVQPFNALEGIFVTEVWDSKNQRNNVTLGLTVSLMMALVESSGKLEDIQLPDPAHIVETATVTVKRIGRSPFTFTFTKKMAADQNLLGKFNWKNMFPLMMMNRAISGALRPVFPDVLKGMYLIEEVAPSTVLDDTGTPIEIIETETVEEDKPTNITTLQQPPDTEQAAESIRDAMGKVTVQDMIDGTMPKVDPLAALRAQVKHALDGLALSDGEIARLAGVDRFDNLDAWKAFGSTGKAVAAVVEAFNAEQAKTSPAVTLKTRDEVIASAREVYSDKDEFDRLIALIPPDIIPNENARVLDVISAIQLQKQLSGKSPEQIVKEVAANKTMDQPSVQDDSDWMEDNPKV